MRVISDGGTILAVIHKKKDWKLGLDFITEDESFIQVGTWWYDGGKKLATHSHKKYVRSASLTQEIVFVVSGSLKATIFNSKLDLVESVILCEGDFAILLDGAHGYEILENNTKVLEAKNGPFVSVEKDKVKYE
jgi:hypothetical protein